eukprot:28180-Pyramimonas_sp.AAC.1
MASRQRLGCTPTFIHRCLRPLAAPPAMRMDIMAGELTGSATPTGHHGPQRSAPWLRTRQCRGTVQRGGHGHGCLASGSWVHPPRSFASLCGSWLRPQRCEGTSRQGSWQVQPPQWVAVAQNLASSRASRRAGRTGPARASHHKVISPRLPGRHDMVHRPVANCVRRHEDA